MSRFAKLSKLEWQNMTDTEFLKYGDFFSFPERLIEQIGGTYK